MAASRSTHERKSGRGPCLRAFSLVVRKRPKRPGEGGGAKRGKNKVEKRKGRGKALKTAEDGGNDLSEGVVVCVYILVWMCVYVVYGCNGCSVWMYGCMYGVCTDVRM